MTTTPRKFSLPVPTPSYGGLARRDFTPARQVAKQLQTLWAIVDPARLNLFVSGTHRRLAQRVCGRALRGLLASGRPFAQVNDFVNHVAATCTRFVCSRGLAPVGEHEVPTCC